MADYTVSIEGVLGLASDCYAIANTYADVAGKITRVDVATGYLTDKDSTATAADTDVIALIDEFFEYLRTTSSRYHLAAEQLEASAATYVTVENDQKDVFDRYMSDWAEAKEDGNDVRDYGNAGWRPNEEADDTARPEGTTELAEGFNTQEGN